MHSASHQLERYLHFIRVALRAAMAGAMRNLTLHLLAALLALTGAGFLVAAGFGVLVHLIGVIGALAVTGIVLLMLAGVVLLLRTKSPPPVILTLPEPLPRPAPDPLAQIVFDLSFQLGRKLRRRRD